MSQEQAEVAERPGHDGPGATVLLIDDDQALQRQLAYQMEDCGYRVIAAMSGREASHYLEETPIEVALVDIGLPDMDGIELLALARRKQPEISVLVLTGRASLETSIQAVFLGAEGYLLKPVDPSFLEAQVGEAVGKCVHRRQNRERYRQILRALHGWQAVAECLQRGLISLTPEGRVDAFDPEATSLLGVNTEEARGQPLWEIIGRGERPGAEEIERLASALPPDLDISGLARPGWQIDDGPGARSAAAAPPAESPIRDSRLVNQLLLASRMAAIGHLASGVAHEINNPLQVIQGWIETLREEPPRHEAANLALERMDQSVERCIKIIRSLGRAAAPKEVRARPLSLSTVAQNVLDLLQHELPTRNIKATIDAAPGLPTVMADEDEMHQVFLNLLLNSRDAMPDGGEIHIRMESAGRLVRIDVADTGSGIPREILGKVFDPFFTTKAPDRGTGLGLYVTHGLVQKHQGQMSIESVVGKGTRVRLVFAGTHAAPEVTALPARKTSQVPSTRILVVDDEESILELLGTWLRGQGHEVSTCLSGDEAVELTRSGQCLAQVVILDLKMPGMSGWKALEQMRSHLPFVPVIILTGSLEPDLPAGVVSEIEIVELVKKPVRLGELDEVIARVLARRAALPDDPSDAPPRASPGIH